MLIHRFKKITIVLFSWSVFKEFIFHKVFIDSVGDNIQTIFVRVRPVFCGLTKIVNNANRQKRQLRQKQPQHEYHCKPQETLGHKLIVFVLRGSSRCWKNTNFTISFFSRCEIFIMRFIKHRRELEKLDFTRSQIFLLFVHFFTISYDFYHFSSRFRRCKRLDFGKRRKICTWSSSEFPKVESWSEKTKRKSADTKRHVKSTIADPKSWETIALGLWPLPCRTRRDVVPTK